MILDNNVVFALMKPDSTASAIFELKAFFLEAPKFVKSEFEEHESECREKSGLSLKRFEERKAEVFAKIRLVNVQEYKHFLKKALLVVSDEDDAPYVALALATGKPIWSNDGELKKLQHVLVLTTTDVVKLLEK